MSNSKKAQMLRNQPVRIFDKADNLYGSEKALVPQGDGSLMYRGMRLTPKGLQFDRIVSEQDMFEIASIINHMDTSLAWWVGDLLNEYETQYGDIRAIADILGFKEGTLSQYKWVASSVEFSRRLEILTFGHHDAVASLTSDEQIYWLNKAAEGDNGKRWSVARLRAEINPKPRLSAGDKIRQQYAELPEDERPAFLDREWKAAQNLADVVNERLSTLEELANNE